MTTIALVTIADCCPCAFGGGACCACRGGLIADVKFNRFVSSTALSFLCFLCSYPFSRLTGLSGPCCRIGDWTCRGSFRSNFLGFISFTSGGDVRYRCRFLRWLRCIVLGACLFFFCAANCDGGRRGFRCLTLAGRFWHLARRQSFFTLH